MINSFINLLKWPLALLAVLFLIPVAHRLWRVLEHMYQYVDTYTMLIYGMLAYIGAWILWLKDSPMGQWFSTLEHEMTHAFFAIISFNRVVGLSATGHAGGVMQYQGYGNWLITISPYFVPSLSLLVLLGLSIAKPTFYPVLLFLMGFTLAYHLQSTLQETHLGQTDLQKSGWLFVILFLPTANLLMLLVLLTALPNDALSTERSLQYAWQDLNNFIQTWQGRFGVNLL